MRIQRATHRHRVRAGLARTAFQSRLLLLCLVCAIGIVGCGSTGEGPGPPEVDSPPVYGPDSWRELIRPDCQSFFDGCNRCEREPGSDVAACTRKACVRYDAPRCLDE